MNALSLASPDWIACDDASHMEAKEVVRISDSGWLRHGLSIPKGMTYLPVDMPYPLVYTQSIKLIFDLMKPDRTCSPTVLGFGSTRLQTS